MGIAGAYLKETRVAHKTRSANTAVKDYADIVEQLPLKDQEVQASRCMECGVPFCMSGMNFAGARQATGCPLHNAIPEVNDLLCKDHLAKAAARLSFTNPFPEFTSRVCPAPCEVACNLGLHEQAVTIHDNERAVSDFAWNKGLMKPLKKASKRAPLASIVGSGPAGLACAWQLTHLGWRVHVYEKSDAPGGLLMYGIPQMKLEKSVIEKRIELMKKSGIEFYCGVDAAKKAPEILKNSDAVILATGAGQARQLNIDGVDLAGVHYALEYLTDCTKAVLAGKEPKISAKGKDVAVIGGGDTGVDCVAYALRQGAKSVKQIIRAPRAKDTVNTFEVWPAPRNVYTQGYGQHEAEEIFGQDPRIFATDTLSFESKDGKKVSGVRVCDIDYSNDKKHVKGSEQELPAQLVLIAKGFVGPQSECMKAFGVQLAADKPLPLIHQDSHLAVLDDAAVAAIAGKGMANTTGDSDGADAAGGVGAAGSGASGAPKVYIAGDCRSGASIVASAMADGLAVAQEVVQGQSCCTSGNEQKTHIVSR